MNAHVSRFWKSSNFFWACFDAWNTGKAHDKRHALRTKCKALIAMDKGL
jgi:hypothetical protein